MIGDRIVIPSDADPSAHVYCFDVLGGDLLWKVPFEQGVATTLAAVGKRALAVVSATGTVAALDSDSGKLLWSTKPGGSVAAIPRIQSPAADDRRLFVASNNGKVFAIDARSGDVVWRKDLGSRVNASLTLIGKTLYAGALDGLYLINPRSGAVTRKISVGGHVYGTLVSAPPLLLLLAKSDRARIVAFDTVRGEIRWQRETPREWSTFRPLVTGSIVIVGSEEKELCAFALGDGAVRWCRSVGGVPRGLGSSADGMLFVGTLDGKVLAYRLE